jgi:hypothetical protein
VGSWRRKRLDHSVSVHVKRIGDHSRLTIVGCGSEQHGNVCSAAVALGNDELFCVDNTAILDNVSGNRVVVLDRLSRYCLQASDLRIESGLVASQTLEDLLTCNGV